MNKPITRLEKVAKQHGWAIENRQGWFLVSKKGNTMASHSINHLIDEILSYR